MSWSALIVNPTRDNKFIVTKPYRVNNNIVVPQGYKTNGANIPRVFWWVIPPFKPKYLPAVVAHDFLCDKEQYKLADDVFESKLFSIEKSWRTKVMVMAVRLYHKIRYGVWRCGLKWLLLCFL